MPCIVPVGVVPCPLTVNSMHSLPTVCCCCSAVCVRACVVCRYNARVSASLQPSSSSGRYPLQLTAMEVDSKASNAPDTADDPRAHRADFDPRTGLVYRPARTYLLECESESTRIAAMPTPHLCQCHTCADATYCANAASCAKATPVPTLHPVPMPHSCESESTRVAAMPTPHPLPTPHPV